MKLTAHSLTVDSFVPMLTSLSQWLDKGFAQKGTEIDLVNARLAPDMFTLAQQVQQACRYATDGAARLCGRPAMAMEATQTTPDGINARSRMPSTSSEALRLPNLKAPKTAIAASISPVTG